MSEDYIQETASNFRIEAKKARSYANKILFVLVLPLLGLAVFTFLRAGFFADLDLQSISENEVSRQIKTMSAKVNSLQDNITSIDEINQKREKEYNRLEKQKAELEKIIPYDIILVKQKSDEMLSVLQLIDYSNGQKEKIRSEIGAILASMRGIEIESGENKIDIVAFAQLNITRFGATAVIIYVVSLLMNIYRHKIRYSANMRVAADMILLSQSFKNADQLIKLVESLSVRDDFGKNSNQPTRQAAELIEALSRFRNPPD